MMIQHLDASPILFLVPLLPNWHQHFCLVPEVAGLPPTPRLWECMTLTSDWLWYSIAHSPKKLPASPYNALLKPLFSLLQT